MTGDCRTKGHRLRIHSRTKMRRNVFAKRMGGVSGTEKDVSLTAFVTKELHRSLAAFQQKNIQRFPECSTLSIVIPIVLSYQSVCIPGRMCSCGLRSCGGHGSGTAVSSLYAAEPTPEERAQRIAKAVRKQSTEVKENWEQLKTRASNWQKQVEKALEKLQELQKALDDLEAHVITAEGVHTDWQPVGDLLIDSLQDHIDKTTGKKP
ncbi:uncharacterized protein LOC132210882 isoform X3 [Stegostoma tigrinum]|uniref:uncharacterized protein LOC132210882 isoform X3 n=1 Tax=Stegostoma tigrinum TaxID=3053191 RepID=UPI00286FB1D1|nr:uncharacterized protein LOC132210882 isoform X3 [Stegostoma tigrinum]XP_059509837.1 uncharacterized protein LOC132210882 isoform X3 [Stegostoma tigrinum]